MEKSKRQDRELSHEQLSSVLEIAIDGSWDWRIDTGRLIFDQRYYAMTGYTPKELPATLEAWKAHLHPEDLVSTTAALTEHLDNATDRFQVEHRFNAKHKGWIWVLCRGRIIERDGEGRPAHMIWTHTDITDKKRYERHATDAPLEHNSEHLQHLLFENTHDAIFIAQDGVLKYANPSTERLLGYAKEELARIPFSNLIHPDDRQAVADRHIKRLKGQDALPYYTFRAINKQKEDVWLEINAILVEWEGRPAVLCLLRDITENRKMEQQLLQAQKMQAIGTLAGGIAHDFNNILSAIMGFTEICLSEADTAGPMMRRLNRILHAGHRARELVDQILTFSRQEELAQKPVQVRMIVKETLKLLRATIPSTIQFQEKLDKDAGIVMADPTRIHQVVINLCSNAAHAMQDKGGTLTVSLKNRTLNKAAIKAYVGLKPGPYVCLTVIDSGHGMSPETIKRIFEPYFTTKKQGEGTGLGLSSVHGIVTTLGGAINVSSTPGEGTVFEICLPRIVSDMDDESIPEASYPKGDETILVVDDEAFVLEMMREMLEGLGYSIVSRISSVEALKAFKGKPESVDLVITDLTMPHMTGLELAGKIREIAPRMPIILCTGFSEEMTEEKAKAMGLQNVLHKPILKRDLAYTIRTILDNQ